MIGGEEGKILPYSPADFTIGAVMKIFGFVLGVCALFVSCSPAPKGVAGTGGSDPIPARERSFIPWRSMNLYDRNGTKTGSARKSGTSINQYDRYGVKTGSLRETSDGYASYDKYGVKTGSYKTSGTTTTHYDRYGSKVGTYSVTRRAGFKILQGGLAICGGGRGGRRGGVGGRR